MGEVWDSVDTIGWDGEASFEKKFRVYGDKWNAAEIWTLFELFLEGLSSYLDFAIALLVGVLGSSDSIYITFSILQNTV